MTDPDVHRRRAIRFAVGAVPLFTLTNRLAVGCEDQPVFWTLAWIWAAAWCFWAASVGPYED
jgi:hypothetical protein